MRVSHRLQRSWCTLAVCPLIVLVSCSTTAATAAGVSPNRIDDREYDGAPLTQPQAALAPTSHSRLVHPDASRDSLPSLQTRRHWNDNDGLPDELTLERGATADRERNNQVSYDIQMKDANNRINSENYESSRNQNKKSGKTDDDLRGIMENFADDFDSPPDTHLSEDIFNREPYYYDDYYDDVETFDVPILADAAPELMDAKSIIPKVATTSADEVLPEDMELRLLGADLQEQLGYILGHLTNGTLRSRRHQTPVRVSLSTQLKLLFTGLEGYLFTGPLSACD